MPWVGLLVHFTNLFYGTNLDCSQGTVLFSKGKRDMDLTVQGLFTLHKLSTIKPKGKHFRSMWLKELKQIQNLANVPLLQFSLWKLTTEYTVSPRFFSWRKAGLRPKSIAQGTCGPPNAENYRSHHPWPLVLEAATDDNWGPATFRKP